MQWDDPGSTECTVFMLWSEKFCRNKPHNDLVMPLNDRSANSVVKLWLSRTKRAASCTEPRNVITGLLMCKS